MRARSLGVALLFLLMPVLAGCIGSDDGGPAPSEDVNPNNNTTVDLPEDRGDVGSAYEETNVTEDGVGGMAHDHDYWAGKSRVRIFETTAEMEPYPDASNRPYAEFRIPSPGLVYEGTGSVELTLTNPRRHVCEGEEPLNGEWICTDTFGGPNAPDPGTTSTLRVEYMHAATSDWQDAGEVAWDTPLEIPLTDPAQTDMPHSTASLWKFRVTSANPQDVTLIFDAVGEIVKAGEVIDWPGHPDFYAESPWRKVMDAPGSTTDAGRDVNALGDTTEDTSILVPDRLVSWGTKTLWVWVNISSVSGNLPPTHWYLQWHNATGDWRYTNMFSDNFSAGETQYLFKLPVTDDGMDSPYAGTSRWEFAFIGAYSSPILACEADCQQYRVDYNMAILATNETLPDEEYSDLWN